jgi:hypothetical protein
MWTDLVFAMIYLLAGTILLIVLYTIIAPLTDNPNDPKFGAKTLGLFCTIVPISYAIPGIIVFIYEHLVSKYPSNKD